MVIRDAESERPPACDPATRGASKGRTESRNWFRSQAPRAAIGAELDDEGNISPAVRPSGAPSPVVGEKTHLAPQSDHQP